MGGDSSRLYVLCHTECPSGRKRRRSRSRWRRQRNEAVTSVLSRDQRGLAANTLLSRLAIDPRCRRRFRSFSSGADLLARTPCADATNSAFLSRRVHPSSTRLSPFPSVVPPPLTLAFHPLLVVRRHLFAACALRGGGRSLRGAGCLRPSDAPFAGCERQEGRKQRSGGGTPGGVQVQVHAYRRQ